VADQAALSFNRFRSDHGHLGYTFSMDAEPFLRLVARALSNRRLEAVLIGNAAAALQGSPVTTLDLDFMFRKTPTNLRKIKGVADDLEAVVMRPYYPTSDLYRVVRDRDGLQLDFMARIDGIRSFERLRASASPIAFGDSSILVAALRDIIRSKKAAGRPQDLAILPTLQRTLDEIEKA
jgi:predicted nucleotidyltransferase